MANNTVDVSMNERHQSYMQSCCSEGRCFKNFIDLDTRIMDDDPAPLFSYLHSNDNSVFINSTPTTNKWLKFMIDVWQWRTHQLFEEGYVTDLNVNSAGSGKIYAAWRVLDQYRGRYRSRNLTRNVVDIMITIPEQNVVIYEHFCFKYFSRSKGSPYTLVPHILTTALAKLYDRYYVDRSLNTIGDRVHFTCAYCSHDQDEGPEDKHVQTIPKWYLDELYRTTNKVSRFD